MWSCTLVHERNVAPTAYDDVIENTDADELADFAEAARDLQVFLARRGVRAWMIVHEDDGGGAVADHLSVNVTRVDDAGRERSLRDEHVTELAVLGVEEDGVEVFDRFTREALAEVRVNVGGAPKGGAGNEFLFAEAFCEFHECGEAFDGGGREADGVEVSRVCGGEVAEVSVGARQVLADAPGCGAEELGEDLGSGCGGGVPACGVGGVRGGAFPDCELGTAGDALRLEFLRCRHLPFSFLKVGVRSLTEAGERPDLSRRKAAEE